MGKTRTIDALATLAFAYPRRADYFRGELQTYLLMAREEGKDPLTLRGSFAGAMGYGQFMPSAFQAYAVDFNGDGHVNLWDPVDAIGSVASYFKGHGWTPGAAVAVQANGQAPGLDNGFKTRYSVSELAQAGLSPGARWRMGIRSACCALMSAAVTSTGTVCPTSTPLPAITTAPTTPWPYGCWASRWSVPRDADPAVSPRGVRACRGDVLYAVPFSRRRADASTLALVSSLF